MARVSERKKIDIFLGNQEKGLQDYFGLLPELLDNISSSEPALAYCFQRIEMAQRNGLYALLMREYRTDSSLSWDAIDAIHISRKSFPEHFQVISGKQLPNKIRDIIAPAEAVRDAIMHGRYEAKAEVHRAIFKCLTYAEEVNKQFQKKVGFKPFGPLRGVTSRRGKPQLDEKISKAVLSGLKLSLFDVERKRVP
tara:strand:+ start:140 stop:724 length:585 start_codon:yes stop_codon:yes gene_type:complete